MLREVHNRPGLSDPVWEYLLKTRLEPYIPRVRKWWNELELFTPCDTGVFTVPDSPPGLFARFTRTAVRSPIKGIQAFPFVPVSFLQMTNVQGGASKMVSRVCPFEIDEFMIVAKNNLPSTYNSGQLICFIPTKLWEERSSIGQWIYLNADEIAELVQGIVPKSVKDKGMLKI